MFSVEYFNKVVFITAHSIRRINFHYYSKLRKLIIVSLKQPCDKIIINFLGVRMIDRSALEMLNLMRGLASNLGVQLIFININDDLKEFICQFSQELENCFGCEADYLEYTR